ncbi:MAG: tRNA glutamyl-Q(34) synthetase GluQRS [Kistimonas sp.]|nr:tRNA glutamyl-Q(34) synthetase GluQRS [Kistimonas sp.]
MGSEPASGHYVGRFAPSPTGPLHQGSLLTALASWLDARCTSGQWLVRMEDLDRPREMPGARGLILKALERHGLNWDGDVLYQTDRLAAYTRAVSLLKDEGWLYPCTCSRRQLLGLSVYPGWCRAAPCAPGAPQALRFRVSDQHYCLNDRIQGLERFHLEDSGDFVVVRRDGVFAYQLAVVVDDQDQGVTHVVRGIDLMTSTPRQKALQSALGYRTLSYAHLPVVVNRQGEKLSKQNRAQPLSLTEPRPAVVQALKALGLPVDDHVSASSLPEILDWARQNWNPLTLCGTKSIPETTATC